MARRPRKTEETSPIVKALKFAASIQKADGEAYLCHSRIENNYIVAHNGILTVGYPIEDDLYCNPHTLKFLAALEKASGAASLSVSQSAVTVKTDVFRASVPVVPDLYQHTPDPRRWPLTNKFREAASKAALMLTDAGKTMVESAAITQDGSIVGTNGRLLIEAWHGLPTPPGLILPNVFIDKLSKIDLNIEGFGFSPYSFTIYFDEKVWLKTQLYQGDYPNINFIIDQLVNPRLVPVNAEMYKAIHSVAPFSADGDIYLGNVISSHAELSVGADYVLPITPVRQRVKYESLKMIEHIVKTFDFESNDKIIIFHGDGIRGGIVKQIL